MVIIFHLEKFQLYGKNKAYMLFSGIYLLFVSLISGVLALVRCKKFKVSLAYDKRMTFKRKRMMNAETAKKSNLKSSGNHSFNNSNLNAKNIDLGNRRKSVFELVSASVRNVKVKNKIPDKTISSLSDVRIPCVSCNVRESDCILRECNHAVYCQFCAKEIFRKFKKCKICFSKIEEVLIVERDVRDGEIYILKSIKK